MDQVRIGIIGLGNMGKGHYSYMDELQGAKLTAVCDIDPERIARLTESVDFDHDTSGLKPLADDVATFTDYRELLDSGLVDLIIIAVPHYFHPEMAIAAFERGIHVICEKPVAITAKEARQMNEAHAASNVVFSVMFQLRTNPAYRKIKELIDNGTVGEIRRINFIATHWFRTQAYYDSGEWRGTWTGEGGGVLMNQCPHHLDLFQWFFGLPVKVTALSYLGKWHDITVEDDVSAVMEMENGATASFVTTTADTPGTERFEVTGEYGKLVYEGGRIVFYKVEQPVQEILNTSEKGFYSSRPEKVEVEIPKALGGKHILVTQNVVNTILGKEELLISGEEGIKSLQLANAMLYSGVKGQLVHFPVPEDDYVAFLEELREDERRNHPEKVFDWEEYLRQMRRH